MGRRYSERAAWPCRNKDNRWFDKLLLLPWSITSVPSEILPGELKIQNHQLQEIKKGTPNEVPYSEVGAFDYSSRPENTNGYWMIQIPPFGFSKRSRPITRVIQPSTPLWLRVDSAMDGSITAP